METLNIFRFRNARQLVMILIQLTGYRMPKLPLWVEMTEQVIKFGLLLTAIREMAALENSIKKMTNQACTIGE